MLENIPEYSSLSDLCHRITKAVSDEFPNYYWVKAEIAKLNYYPKSGHCYPELIEKKDNEIKAEIRAFIWSSTFSALNSKFLQETKESLREGITILVLAKPQYSPKYGLSLYIADIIPSFTLGEMALEKQKCIEKLKSEGLFDFNHSLSLPELPKRLAIISVETSKGYNDFRNIIDHNENGFKIEYFLHPAILQGDNAIDSILTQFERIQNNRNNFDAVLLIRGGGGDTGLSCYNHYNLAKTVATFPLPVFTGIGHSTNETVVEMVSRLNKITPTDLAYYILNCFETELKIISGLQDDFFEEIKTKLYHQNLWLNKKLDSFDRIAGRPLEIAKNLLFQKMHKISIYTNNIIVSYKSELNRKQSFFSEKCKKLLNDNFVKVLRNKETLKLSVNKKILNHHKDILLMDNKARLLDPKNILKRGYSITSCNGKIVKNAMDLKKGDKIRTELNSGIINSIIE